ncbi:antitoxin [Salipaludibacillus sp. LMS25]|uniref:CopG family ribbon-helix-helix protein n=1 Tax=Salipaludibacillus sp. LMS25 TaxID=2924031 RepID=UPI0020D157E4|nr:antitoxin [Salipaludibacillus sp. LMS25]UTR17019.1 antitoxin [Salipaludibacillus sp. LMS25]
MENTKKIMVNLPQHLVNELDALTEGEGINRCDVIQRATRIYVQEQKKLQIRETMEQGYMEMAKINLNIATESFLAEEEAESTVDRLVSGV